MDVTLTVNSDAEKSLLARAHARGVSLGDYLQEIVAREAGLPAALPAHERFDNLSDLLLNSPFSGADLDLERCKDYPRAVEIE